MHDIYIVHVEDRVVTISSQTSESRVYRRIPQTLGLKEPAKSWISGRKRSLRFDVRLTSLDDWRGPPSLATLGSRGRSWWVRSSWNLLFYMPSMWKFHLMQSLDVCICWTERLVMPDHDEFVCRRLSIWAATHVAWRDRSMYIWYHVCMYVCMYVCTYVCMYVLPQFSQSLRTGQHKPPVIQVTVSGGKKVIRTSHLSHQLPEPNPSPLHFVRSIFHLSGARKNKSDVPLQFLF